MTPGSLYLVRVDISAVPGRLVTLLYAVTIYTRNSVISGAVKALRSRSSVSFADNLVSTM